MTAAVPHDRPPSIAFGARLRDAMEARGPLCVGIDPHASLLGHWGLPDNADGLERFALTVVAALGDRVAVLKPQSAFFERHGSAGVAVLERTIAAGREAGCLVLLDVKRGDIGSTAAAYADAYLHPRSRLAADAVTVSPYLGFGSLRPFLAAAAQHDRGVFVVAMTSNPEGAEVQRAERHGVGVAAKVLEQVAAANRAANQTANQAGGAAWGPYGAVVGAAVHSPPANLAVHGPLLAPGFGAQGGRVDDLRRVFAGVLRDVLPSTSRDVLTAGPRPADLRAATAAALDSLEGLMG